MLDAGREALSFIEGRTREDLLRDRMLLLALIKEIEIIGEAASRISAESKKKLPDVPWPLVVGMRNRLIHAYGTPPVCRIISIMACLRRCVARASAALGERGVHGWRIVQTRPCRAMQLPIRAAVSATQLSMQTRRPSGLRRHSPAASGRTGCPPGTSSTIATLRFNGTSTDPRRTFHWVQVAIRYPLEYPGLRVMVAVAVEEASVPESPALATIV
jgi:hypothetical protein